MNYVLVKKRTLFWLFLCQTTIVCVEFLAAKFTIDIAARSSKSKTEDKKAPVVVAGPSKSDSKHAKKHAVAEVKVEAKETRSMTTKLLKSQRVSPEAESHRYFIFSILMCIQQACFCFYQSLIQI